jgi:hypothetical protein
MKHTNTSLKQHVTIAVLLGSLLLASAVPAAFEQTARLSVPANRRALLRTLSGATTVSGVVRETVRFRDLEIERPLWSRRYRQAVAPLINTGAVLTGTGRAVRVRLPSATVWESRRLQRLQRRYGSGSIAPRISEDAATE